MRRIGDITLVVVPYRAEYFGFMPGMTVGSLLTDAGYTWSSTPKDIRIFADKVSKQVTLCSRVPNKTCQVSMYGPSRYDLPDVGELRIERVRIGRRSDDDDALIRMKCMICGVTCLSGFGYRSIWTSYVATPTAFEVWHRSLIIHVHLTNMCSGECRAQFEDKWEDEGHVFQDSNQRTISRR